MRVAVKDSADHAGPEALVGRTTPLHRRRVELPYVSQFQAAELF